MVHRTFSYSVLIALFFSLHSYGMNLDIIPRDKIEMSPSEKFERQLFKPSVDKLNKLKSEFTDSCEQKSKPTFLEYSDRSKSLAQKMSVNPDTAREILIGGLINAIAAPQGNDEYIALYTKIQVILDSEENRRQSTLSPHIENPITLDLNTLHQDLNRAIQLDLQESMALYKAALKREQELQSEPIKHISYSLDSSRDPMEIKIFLTKEELQEKKELQRTKAELLQEKEELQKKGPSIEQKSSWYKKYLPTFKAAAGIGLGLIGAIAFFDYLNHLSDKLAQWFMGYMPKYSNIHYLR